MDRACKLALRAIDREHGPRLHAAAVRLSEARRAHYLAARDFVGGCTSRIRNLERYAESLVVLRPDSPAKERLLAAAHAEIAARLIRLDAEGAYWRARSETVRAAATRHGGATYLDELRAVQAHWRGLRALSEARYLGASAAITVYRRLVKAGAVSNG